MNQLPYELVFAVAIHLDSPKDLCSLSRVCSLFCTVSRDDRIWKRLCYRLYNLKPAPDEMKLSFYHLFSKILVPYGRYLGYWKSNEIYYGGLIDIYLNLSDETIVGEKLNVGKISYHLLQAFLVGEDDNNKEDNEPFLKSYYPKDKLFTIDCKSNQIFCHECDTLHSELPWIKKFDSNEIYFGLSQEALPRHERSSLIAHDHNLTECPEGNDIYFVRNCSSESIVYHPISIPQPCTADNAHPLSRFNGLWIGSYGGHGLELLHIELCHDFNCPPTVDGSAKDVEIIPHALVGRKITGDPNVPHSKISFAATHSMETNSNSTICYDGIGQIAHSGYLNPQFIRTKITPISENILQITWYSLHHNSFLKRCLL